ncbi:MAG: 7-carboxy-7-deazaguanine synthase QueE [Acidobacteria bacterium]|jgi:organic radical activating enzyme|nr:MAG: 7-carboxy-7-deazaguanine synthase QueE [Acidobacteriota bacterium]
MLRNKIGSTTSIAVNEIYPTIQGEGLLLGKPSLFIRLQGCNLRCPWCDQPSALAFKEGNLDLEELLQKVKEYPHRHVVITGGEPFLQDGLSILVKNLLELERSVQIETNGTLWQREMEEIVDKPLHITCSPKGEVDWYVHPKILQYASELKFVVDQHLTFDVILRENFRKLLEEDRVVLQPEGNKAFFLKKSLQMQERLLGLGYQVRVIPQMHKLLGLK